LDLHSDLEVMSFFQEDMRVSNDMICDFNRFEDDLSYKVGEEVFQNAGGRHDQEDAEHSRRAQEAGQKINSEHVQE